MGRILPLTLLFLACIAAGQPLAHNSAPETDSTLRLKILAAKDAGIDTTRRFREELDMYARELAMPYLRDRHVDDSLINVAYGRLGEIIDVNHVFLPTPSNASEREKTLVLADSLRAELFNRQDFGEKATVTGGNWPYFFEEMAFATPVGSVSEVTESPYGFHIVRVNGRNKRTDAIPPLDSVKNKITYAIMHDERAAMAVHRTISRWKSRKAGRNNLTFDNALTEFIRELPENEPAYRVVLEDYRTGMMVYEITEQEVWQRARTDSAGLQRYFEEHRDQFTWDRPHYKGFIVSAANDSLADAAVKYLTDTTPGDPSASRSTSIRKRYGNDVRVDQVIVAQGDNKVVDYLCFNGSQPADDRWKAYRTALGRIITSPECAADIKGSVTERYQQALEEQWVRRLRERYR